jgi:hypothetical protein
VATGNSVVSDVKMVTPCIHKGNVYLLPAFGISEETFLFWNPVTEFLNFSKLYNSSCTPYLGVLQLRRAHSHCAYNNSVNESKDEK